jgi:hypothetical protein
MASPATLVNRQQQSAIQKPETTDKSQTRSVDLKKAASSATAIASVIALSAAAYYGIPQIANYFFPTPVPPPSWGSWALSYLKAPFAHAPGYSATGIGVLTFLMLNSCSNPKGVKKS